MAALGHTIDPDGTGDYLSLVAWDAAQAQDLTDAGGDTYAADYITSGGSADTGGILNLDGWVTDSSHFITITVPEVHMHDGKRNTSKVRLVVSDAFDELFSVSADFTVIIGMQARNSHVNGYSAFNITGDDCVLKYCIGYDNGISQSGRGHMVWDAADRTVLINCAALNCGGDGFRKNSGGTGDANASYYFNCTAMGSGGDGVQVQDFRNLYTTNCYFGGSADNDIELVGGSSVITILTTYTEDGSESTPIAAYSTSAGAYFTNVTSGSEDPHISTDSSLKDNGTDLGADGNWFGDEDDIDRDLRGVVWDVGADEFIVVGVTNPWYYYAQQ